jgi:EmrB/QacA subfamily drug resistance transporter
MANTKTVGSPPSSEGGAGGGNPWLTLLAVSLGVVMVMLDGTVMGVAAPRMGAELQATLSDMQWVTNGYLLALAVFLITAGKLGDIYGHRRVFLVGVVGFAASSAAIALSGSVTSLIVFRVLQGLFGALLQPAALALLRSAFPKERLAQAMGAWGAIIGLSSAAGPLLGGWLVEHVNWQSVFWINLPVGVAALVMGIMVLKENRAGVLSKIDWPGVALLSGMMFALVWTIIKAPEWGWTDSQTLIWGGIFVVLAAGFIWWQSKAKDPLVPLSLFRNRSITIGTILMMMVAFAMFGAMFFLGFFFQGVHGLDPFEAGMRMLPMSAGMIVASPLAAVALGKLGPKITMSAGLLITALAMFLMSRIGMDASFVETGLPFLLLAFGMSPVFVGATEIIVGNAPMELSGAAGGIQQSAMQVGGALGTAILGAVMAGTISDKLGGYLGPVGQAMPAPALEGLEKAAAFGTVPPELTQGLQQQVVEALTNAVRLSFMDGMNTAFVVSTVVALITAGLALLVRSGRKIEGEPVHIG